MPISIADTTVTKITKKLVNKMRKYLSGKNLQKIGQSDE